MDSILSNLRTLYNEYDEFRDLLKEIGEYYVYQKEVGEYGLSVFIYKFTGELIGLVFISSDENRVEGFMNYNTLRGIDSHIYSNRTKYYINNEYHSDMIDDDLIMNDLINKHTKLVLEDKKYPMLYEFIKGDDKITLINKAEFDKAEF